MINKSSLKEDSRIVLPEGEISPSQRAIVDTVYHEFVYVTIIKEDRDGGLLDNGIREIYIDDLPEVLKEF